MKNILYIITVLSLNFSFAQSPNLINFNIDTLTLESINKANLSKDNWIFKIKNDSVFIEQNKFNHQKGDSLPFEEKYLKKKLKTHIVNPFVKKVHNGFLIGLNNGEFGGGLYFLSKNGRKSYEIASYMRVRQILELNSNIYVSSGIAHLGTNYGSIYKLAFINKKWKFIKSLSLLQMPTLIVFNNNIPFVITSKYILKLDDDINSYEEILKLPFSLGTLYPSSAIISDNDIFIAMRKRILKISDFETEPKYEWYTKGIETNN